MLETWQIWDFKSFGSDTKALTLPPVSILVGANSSGKSSILQTILLMKQTFQYGGADRPVLLNGPLLRLGNFYDVKNALSPARGFRLSFSVNFKAPVEPDPVVGRNAFLLKSPQILKISCDVTFGLDAGRSADEISLLQPFLRRSVTNVIFKEREEITYRTIWAKRARRYTSERPISELIADVENRQLTDLRIHYMSEELSREVSEKRPSSKIHGAYHRYMIADRLLVSFDQAEQQALSIGEQFSNPYFTFLGSAYLETLTPDMLDAIKDEVISWLLGNDGEPDTIEGVRTALSLSEILRLLQFMITIPRESPIASSKGLLRIPEIPRELNAAGTDLRERVQERIRQEFGDERSLEMVRPPILNSTAQALQDYFTKKVRYLGPLRESPKPLYPLEALGDPTDVGYRGEHTAAVLDLNKRHLIQYVGPPSEAGKFPKAVRGSLQSAVVAWLQYMDLVSDVATGDRGKFGRELQVSMSDIPKLHDLTNVGVGVSQVLPIIVMALLSPDDSAIILEQPELHLHPRVQSRLGDFLLAMSMLGKQCIVETHSEHLIYRLRRRVAESTENLGDDIGLYFVERLRGQTKVKRVDINAFGSLSEWPRGFFDQSQLEAERIVRAAAKKHTARKTTK